MNMRVIIVVAFESETGAIGYNGELYHHMKADMIHFRQLTTKSALGKHNLLVMGRKTWDSIPNKPLAKRENLVLTNRSISGIICKTDVLDVFNWGISNHLELDNMYVIGGGKVYKDFLEANLVDEIVATVYTKKDANLEKPADTFFPIEYLKDFKLIKTEYLTEDEQFIANICFYKRKIKID